MRRSITWTIAGGVIAVALFAGVDALRSGGEPPPAEVSSTEAVTSLSEANRPVATTEQVIERRGNAWASFFSTGPAPPYGQACPLMTQPFCERIDCERAGGIKIENCRLRTSAYRHSFDGARVVDVVIKENRAAARLSNGEVIRFWGDGGIWLVDELGKNAGRGFFE